jgi:hypothetical protein
VFAVNSMLSYNEVTILETVFLCSLEQLPTILLQVKTFREQILRAKDSSKVTRPCSSVMWREIFKFAPRRFP